MEVRVFLQVFSSENPYQRSVENYCQPCVYNIIERNNPTKIMKSHKDLPWLHHCIKYEMIKEITYIFEQYVPRMILIEQPIDNLMSKAHDSYCKDLFDKSYNDSGS